MGLMASVRKTCVQAFVVVVAWVCNSPRGARVFLE
jgi:hypothetical protein